MIINVKNGPKQEFKIVLYVQQINESMNQLKQFSTFI